MTRPRIIALGLVSAMLVAAAGCGNTSEVAPNDTAAPAADEARTATDGGSSSDAGGGSTDAATNPCAPVAIRKLLWGDLHIHTAYSLDSYAFDNTNTPVDAYAFAKKEKALPIAGDPSNSVGIDRKLDFAAVTDHSEFLDVMEECTIDPTSANYNGTYCTDYRTDKDQSTEFATRMAQLALPNPNEPTLCNGAADGTRCTNARKSAWQRLQQAALTATQKEDCSFTGVIAYEWTATTGAANLHRNVIFGTDTVPTTPLDYIHYPSAKELWNGLDAQCTGNCRVLALPHNTNYSNGTMWDEASDSANYSQMEKYQRLVEIYQHKGASECTPGSSGLSDPECDFEAIDLAPNAQDSKGFVRNALAQGLQLGHNKAASANPLMLGIIGATDTHNGTPGAVAETTWHGHAANQDDTPQKRVTDTASFGPGAITGLWAKANTREEIFAALNRRETYATSGPRIAVRFYAKNDVASQADADALCADPTFPANLEAAGGVPMGSELTTAGKDTWFFVWAMKDQTDLAAIELVELSTNSAGAATMTIDPVTPPNPSISCIARKMPALASGSRAAVYARVLEQETWRWSHYDCQDPSVSTTAACDPNTTRANGGVNVTIKERAWTSPIFLF